MISKKARMLFSEVCDAVHANELCLAECTDRRTGKKVSVICAATTKNGIIHLRPLARLFSGNPYNEVAPPGLDAPKLI